MVCERFGAAPGRTLEARKGGRPARSRPARNAASSRDARQLLGSERQCVPPRKAGTNPALWGRPEATSAGAMPILYKTTVCSNLTFPPTSARRRFRCFRPRRLSEACRRHRRQAHRLDCAPGQTSPGDVSPCERQVIPCVSEAGSRRSRSRSQRWTAATSLESTSPHERRLCSGCCRSMGPRRRARCHRQTWPGLNQLAEPRCNSVYGQARLRSRNQFTDG